MLRHMSLRIESLRPTTAKSNISTLLEAHMQRYTLQQDTKTLQQDTQNLIQPNKRHPHNMPYHPGSTSHALFIRHHIHTPTTLQEVLCSICRQRCTDRHQVVQITAHPECQCVFGETCLLQWLRSRSAASRTCPSCRAVLFNRGVDDDEESDGDGEEEDDDEDSEEDETQEEVVRGRQRTRQEKGRHTRRRRTPLSSHSSSRPSSAAFSADESGTPPPRSFHRRRRSPSPSPSLSPSPSPSSSTTSHTLSALPSPTLNPALAIDTLVTDLWAGTWDLVTESWSLTPDGASRSRSITRAQLVMLVRDVNPFEEELEDAVVEHLVVRARKMVVKHRRNGEYADGGELRAEREDVRLAVGYGV